MSQILAGVPLQLKDGREVDAGTHLNNKIVVLYFSASWCRPCRSFTPLLKEFYDTMQHLNKEIEVVLVSRDYMRFQLQDYYEKHGCSWAIMPLWHEKVKELFDVYNVKELPTCRVITDDGTCIVQNARQEVEEFSHKQRRPEELYAKWRQIATVHC
ncbi:unnamed protein product [Caenorhabditis auriculariae]|uniref:Thioredoxin domain-containing protein n=1 Tax=Caenorhabditis auriculariae TaxID=2777116 RepID=A0A8S1HK25_9PELO|nr:unnamed protein product [Caenorhabditis auriculariae]